MQSSTDSELTLGVATPLFETGIDAFKTLDVLHRWKLDPYMPSSELLHARVYEVEGHPWDKGAMALLWMPQAGKAGIICPHALEWLGAMAPQNALNEWVRRSCCLGQPAQDEVISEACGGCPQRKNCSARSA